MAKLSEQFLDEVRFRNPIADLISGYVQLKRAGRLWKGLCPFHSEKSPSFTVYEDNNSYYCFGCGAGGDAITFIRTIDNLDYIDAVRALAERAGMQMPDLEGNKEATHLRERTLAINREAARFYYSALASPQGSAAREYIVKRRLTPETVRHFGLGYAPDDFHSLVDHLKSKGYTEQELIAAGMKVSKNGHPFDQFRGRLIFPIIDVRGNVIAFGGRQLSSEQGGPKYLNSSDTPVFKKSHGVFALNFAKDAKDGSLIICEGYMDVIAMHQAGFTNAVAALGTAFTQEQARLISRYAGEIVLAFDADSAGQKAIARGMSLLRELDVKVRVLKIPGSKDPDEYIRENGADSFKLLLSGATTQTEFTLLGIADRYDLHTSDGRIEYIKECAQVLAAIPSAAEREVYSEKVCTAADISRLTLNEEIENASKRLRKINRRAEMDRTMKALSGFSDTVNPEKKMHLRAASAEEALIAALIASPELNMDILEYLPPDKMVTSFNRRLYGAITRCIIEYGHFDLGMLGSEFTPLEIGRIQSFIISNGRRIASLDELTEYADIIYESSLKPAAADVSNMSDDDFGKLIKSIGNRKNK